MPNNGLALSITAASYAVTPDVDLTGKFEPRFLEIYLSSASVVAFSFDGVNDHGQLDGTNLKTTKREVREKKIWLRVASGTNPATGFLSHWST